MQDETLNEYIDELTSNKSSRNSLHLKFGSINKIQIERLSEALKVNTTHRYLTLENINLGNDGAAILAQAIKENQGIVEVTLSAIDIDDIGFAAIAIALEDDNKISSLRLPNNKITDLAMPVLAGFLIKNKKLESLDLDKNILTNSGAMLLVDAVKQNDSLKRLNLNRAVIKRFNEQIWITSEDELLSQFAEPMIALQADHSLLQNVVKVGYLKLLNKLLEIPEIVITANIWGYDLLQTAINSKQANIIERLLQIKPVYDEFKKYAASILCETMINDNINCYKFLLASLPESNKAQQLAQTLKLAINNNKTNFCDYVLGVPNLKSVLNVFKKFVLKNSTSKDVRNKYQGYIFSLFSRTCGHRLLQANNYQLCSLFNIKFLNAKFNNSFANSITYAQELHKTNSGRDILLHCGFIVENGVAKIATPEEKTLQQRLVLLEQKRAEAQQLLTQVTQLRALHFEIRAQPYKQELERQIPLYSAKRLRVANAAAVADLPTTTTTTTTSGQGLIKRLKAGSR